MQKIKNMVAIALVCAFFMVAAPQAEAAVHEYCPLRLSCQDQVVYWDDATRSAVVYAGDYNYQVFPGVNFVYKQSNKDGQVNILRGDHVLALPLSSMGGWMYVSAELLEVLKVDTSNK